MGSPSAKLGLASPLSNHLSKRAKTVAKKRATQVVCDAFEPLAEYRDKPVEFIKDILGVTLTDIQAKIAESIRDNERTSVAACYASGKTFLAACLLLWWLYTRTPSMVVTTAPTKRQVEKLLWRYVRKLHKRAKIKLPGRLLTTQLAVDDDVLAFGFTGNSGHAVQGIHEAENVLFIEDEAAGMAAEILEDFEGITTGIGSRHAKFGNPTSDSGPFFDSHESPKESGFWAKFNISAFDVINVIKKKTIIPGLVEWGWVQRIREKYGEDSPFWITKVLGKFCRTAGEKVISPEKRDQAKGRYETVSREGLRILGCDIGRTIDESVFVLLEGKAARVVGRMQCDDLTLIADEIERLAVEYEVDRVNIDGTGLGIGVCDTVSRRRTDGTSPIPDWVNVNHCVLGRGAVDKELFSGILDEIFWALRKAFEPGPDAIGINPEDEALCEHVCWRGYSLQKGKYKVWTKVQTRKEYGSSPDDADALMLCFWVPEEGFLL